MSHSNGAVFVDGVERAYFEYNGTVDIACSRVYNSFDEMRASWRVDNNRECDCGSAGQSVMFYTDYGSGFHWPGRVCWLCMAITEGRCPDGNDADGKPPVTAPPGNVGIGGINEDGK